MTSEEFKNHRTQILRMNQSQLADVIGMSVAAIILWEKGDRRIPKPVIKLVKMIHRYPSLIGEIRTF